MVAVPILFEVYDHEVRKTKLPKYGIALQTKTENLHNKILYKTRYTV